MAILPLANSKSELEEKMREAIGSEGTVLKQTPGLGLITATIILAFNGKQPTQYTRSRTLHSRDNSFIPHYVRVLKRNRMLRNIYPQWFDDEFLSGVAIEQDVEQLSQLVLQPPVF